MGRTLRAAALLLCLRAGAEGRAQQWGDFDETTEPATELEGLARRLGAAGPRGPPNKGSGAGAGVGDGGAGKAGGPPRPGDPGEYRPAPEDDWKECFEMAKGAERRAHVDGSNYGNAIGPVPFDSSDVTCPYVATLLMNGDLATDGDGMILKKCAFARSLAWSGCHSLEVASAFLANEVFVGTSIFHLVGGPSEHRIRSPACCDGDQWSKLAAFAEEGKFGVAELAAAVLFFEKEGTDFRASGNDVLLRVWGLFLTVFGDGEGCPEVGGARERGVPARHMPEDGGGGPMAEAFDVRGRRCTISLDAFASLYLTQQYPPHWRWRTWHVEDANAQILAICEAAGVEECPTIPVDEEAYAPAGAALDAEPDAEPDAAPVDEETYAPAGAAPDAP
ncbi:hypothetical protein M885DRAFT_556479 [Pelagophyceae sp. CCMP2097]|nr:hypothetical protein M885DRAFT_556479 [Pelagophyceae sp. CCMP2097]